MNELSTQRFPRSDYQDPLSAPAMTAQDLGRLLARRLWLILLILAVSAGTAALLSRRTPKAWRATAQVLLVQRAPMMVASAQGVSNAPMIESIDTQITLLQGRKVAELAAKYAGVSADTLLAASTITPRKDGDNVIDLAVEADSRAHAIKWAQALCNAFVVYKNDLAKNSSKERLGTLRVQTAQAQKQMQAADRRLLNFQRTHRLAGIGVVDAGAQKTAALNAALAQDAVVATDGNEYAAAQAKANALSASLQQAKQAFNTAPTVRDDTEINRLQNLLLDLERERRQTAQLYKPNFPGLPGHPRLKDLDARIAATRIQKDQAIKAFQNQPSVSALATLQEAAGNAVSDARTAQVKLAAATRQRDLLKGQLTNLPQISQQSDTLTRSAQSAHTLYDSLSGAAQAALLDRDAASGNVQIAQEASAPPDPFRPSPKRDLMVGLGVGVCLSLLAVFLLEQADRSVRTPADVRRLAEGPVIAALPQMSRGDRSRFLSGETPTHLLETYNAARANLSLAMRRQMGPELDSHQVILVTSAIPGEGKSLTSSELAQSYARAGRRVVLVNADLRRPSSLPLMQPAKSGGAGLAEVLAGEAQVPDALVKSKVPNLSLLFGGKPVLNPMDLFSHPRMAETVKLLRETADVVVIDSPPAAVVADALLLAPYADCVLFVVGIGMVDNEKVRHTAAALSAASPKMLAYFVNRVPHAGSESASYAYAAYRSSPPPAVEASRNYRSSRTVVLERYQDTETGEVVDAIRADPVPSSPEKTNGTRPALRIMPETGSRLTAIEGPYLGQSFALSAGKTLSLGAQPDSDIVLARDGTISKTHARVAPEDGQFVVYDDNSTNGTFVNNALISRHPLEVGDVLHLGASKFRYE